MYIMVTFCPLKKGLFISIYGETISIAFNVFFKQLFTARKYSAFKIESDSEKSNNFCSYLSQLFLGKLSASFLESLEGETQ